MVSRARIVAATLGVVVVAGSAAAQRPQVSFPPGTLVEPGGDQVWKILRCRPEAVSRENECEFVLWVNDGAASSAQWLSARQILDGINRVRAAKGLPMMTPEEASGGAAPAAAPPPAATPPTDPPQAARAPAAPRAAPAAAAGGACPRTPYGGPVAGTTPASPALFKRKIADSYTMAARDPFWIGVTFESVSVGAATRNTVTNVPGRGATRANEGAPPNATMYPVASTYVVCEQSPGRAERHRIVNHHYCFVTRDAEWTCAGGGGQPPRITRIG